MIRSLLLPLAVGGAYVAGLVIAELRRPLRRSREPRIRHDTRNLAIAGLAAATVQLAEQPIVLPLARIAVRRRWGITRWFPMPEWTRDLLAVLLLDYTLYLWHVATHRVPFLWRFHSVHHVDLDCTASTAARFHPGELLCSVAWRAAQVRLFGVSPRAFSWWQTFTVTSILFHHSNLRLPIGWERRIALVVATPRLHGIHHSIEPDEVNSNWSSGLTIWDRLHGTLNAGVPQQSIEIGISGYQQPEQVTLGNSLALPWHIEEFPDTPRMGGHRDTPLLLAE